MTEGNYERVLDKIAQVAGVDKEEIERRVEAKRAKLSGLISKEGAAQVIAAELGVNFDNEKLKIEELLPGMRKVNVTGKAINFFPIRTFERDGKENKVANFIIADETANIKVVLWDTNHIELIEKNELSEGKVIEISNASMRDNEIHLGSFSELKLSSEVMDSVKTERTVKDKKISDFRVGEYVSVRAFVVQAFEPRFFHVCPECKKKAVSGEEGFICATHNKVDPEKRALVNVVLDDGTESVRSVVFHDNLNELGFAELENPEKVSIHKEELLGKEMVFSGNVRMNKFFNNPEFNINSVQNVNLDELVAGLETK